MKTPMTIRRLAKCEHCKNEAHQKLEHHYAYSWGNDVAGIGYVRVYFTFSCETCGEALLYHAGIPGLYLVDEFDVVINDFFHWVVNYVYKAPASLEAFRKRLTQNYLK